jgi:site-specific DNA-methyltransferase (adenine-specific)
METNVIYCGDNLDVLPKYVDPDSVDLIYIDPPFNTSRKYEVFWGEAQERRAFEDRFGDAMTYLDWMRPRIRELYRALKPTGSFYYHCDWHASHYIKVELDRVFGFNNFQNEIIWKRQTAHSDAGRYGHLHDTILFYTKSNRFTWNPEYTEYDPIYIKRYFRYRDQHGLFRSDDMTAPGGRGPRYEWKGITRNWRFTRENMEKLEAEGRIFYTKRGIPRYKRYLDEMPGTPLQSIWIDILPVVSWSSEGLGYPTQKPLALLERIINASSNEGDVVLDAFCGCGTTLEAAAKFKRRWIGVDMSPTACRVMAQRLEKRLGLREGIDFKLIDMPKTEDDLRRIPHGEFENWAVIALGGIPNKVKVGDYGIDGRLYLADLAKERKGDFFETLDKWYPIQVKQQDRAGRPDLDKFETAMRRDKRLKGYFIAFGFSTDAIKEIKRANREDGLDIVPITVKELLEHERRVVS